MKRGLAILLCLLCAMLLLVACGDNNTDTDNQGSNNTDNQGHIHTYKTNAEWSSDAGAHWYEPTCDCADAPITRLAHVDANNDGACDVCTFTNHEHEYSEEWTADCTYHWNAADCGHTVEGTNKAEHSDEDADGRCDVCNYIIEDLHIHVYDKEWSHDEGYHYHAALCEHKVEVADKEAHQVNAAGICTVCDVKVSEVDENDILALLEALLAQRPNVNRGQTIETKELGVSTIVNTADYVLGNGHIYVRLDTANESETNEAASRHEYWTELLPNGETFTIGYILELDHTGHGEVPELNVYSKGADEMEGYFYAPTGLTTAHSIEELALRLYELALAPTTKCTVAPTVDTVNNTVKFQYGYLNIHEVEDSGAETTTITRLYYTVDLELTYDDNLILTSSNVSVSSFFEVGNGSGFDHFTYDAETGEVTIVDPVPASTYSYAVIQQPGERVYTTAYPKASFTPTNFEIVYDGNKVDEDTVINGMSGEPTVLDVSKLYPAGTSMDFFDMSKLSFEVINNTNPEGLVFNPSFNLDKQTITLLAREAGEYTVKVKFYDNVHTFKFVAEANPNVVVDAELIVPNYANPSAEYEFKVIANCVHTINASGLSDDVWIQICKGSDDAWGSKKNAEMPYKLEATAGETIKIRLFCWDASLAGQAVNVTITYNSDFIVDTPDIPDEPDVPELGENEFLVTTTDTYTWIDKYSFTADKAGTYTFTIPAGLGIFDVERYDAFEEYAEVDFMNNTAGETFSKELAEGETWEFYVGSTEKGNFVVSYAYSAEGGNQGGETPDPDIPDVPSEPVDIKGVYDTGDGTLTSVEITETEVIFTRKGTAYPFAYELSNGKITIFNAYGNPMQATVMSVTLDASGNVTGCVYSGTSYTLTKQVVIEPTGLEGTYSFVDDFGNTVVVTVTATEITFVPAGSSDAVTYTYTYAGGIATYTDSLGIEITMPTQFCLVIDTGAVVGMWYNGTQYAPETSGGEEGGDTEADGSMDNPYVIETLPFEVTLGAGHDVYYVYTATEDVIIVITYEDGTYVSNIPSSFEKDEVAHTYTFKLAAGEQTGINLWTMGVNESYTYTITATADVGGGEQGGESSDVVTYTASHPAGTVLTITLDKVSGKVTFTQDSAEPTTVDYTFDGTEIVVSGVEGWMNVTIEFNTDGSLASVTYGTKQYTEFTVKAEGGEGGEGGDDVVVAPDGSVNVSELEGDGSSASPIVIVEGGVYFFESVNAYPGQYITFTAVTDTKLTFTADVSELYTTSWGKLAEENAAYSKEVKAGETVTIIVCMETGESAVLLTVVTEDIVIDDPIVTPPSVDITGTYTGVDFFENTITVVITETEIQFTPPYEDAVVLTYTIANGVVTLYQNGEAITNEYAANLVLTDNVPTQLTFNATNYELTVGGEVEEEKEQVLVLGENAIVVEDAWNGPNVTFTSENGGTYVLSAADGEDNAYISLVTNGVVEEVTLPYEFTLNAGETITFAISTGNYQPDTVDLVIAEKVEEEPAGLSVQFTTIAGGIGKYVHVSITAEETGTYSVALESEVASTWYYYSFVDTTTTTSSSWTRMSAFPYEVTLEAGQTLYIAVYCRSGCAADQTGTIVLTKAE